MIINYEILSNYADVLNPSDLMKVLDIGKNTVYRLLKEEVIQSIRIGRKYKIPKAFLINYLINNTQTLSLNNL